MANLAPGTRFTYALKSFYAISLEDWLRDKPLEFQRQFRRVWLARERGLTEAFAEEILAYVPRMQGTLAGIAAADEVEIAKATGKRKPPKTRNRRKLTTSRGDRTRRSRSRCGRRMEGCLRRQAGPHDR